jgi:hypothetical protein
MDAHLLVTPAIFKPGSISVLRAYGFPIKDFRHDRRRECIFYPSFLNVSIRNLNKRRRNPPFSVIARSD